MIKTSGIIIFIVIVLGACKHSTRFIFQVQQPDSIQAVHVPISKLAINYKNYQGKYIETSGRFYQSFEEFAIYTDEPFTSERKGFWLDMDHRLKIDDDYFTKISGKRVIIKGYIDTSSKGHLGLYQATIKGIYFWQQQ